MVVCTGELYGQEYIDKIKNALERNTKYDLSITIIKESKFPGWWGKMEFFKPGKRVVGMDIDTVITGNIDFLFEYSGGFALPFNYFNPQKYAGDIISTSPKFAKYLWAEFAKQPDRIMKRYRSDQEFYFDYLPRADIWQNLAPGKIKSFKADNLQSGPDGASLVAFHGRPKPHEVNLAWVKEHWK